MKTIPSFLNKITAVMQGRGASISVLYRLWAMAPLWLFFACEKEVDIIPRELEPQVVVEATIENGQAPLVYLTNSLGYFSSLSVADLANSFIHQAQITIQNGAHTVTLKEYSVNMGAAKFYYYTVDSTNPAQLMVGRLGETYKLHIVANGKTFTAQTSIPQVSRKMDSLWWKPAPSNPDTTKAVIFSRFTDPRGYGNYIRYFTSVNDSSFLPGLNSVYDDQIIDGTTYDAQVYRGVNRNVEVNRDEFGYFKRGEKVTIKLCNIDKATFDFWRTWEQNQSNIGNPFGVPVKIMSNLSEGAIGYFGGYASQIITLQIPR